VIELLSGYAGPERERVIWDILELSKRPLGDGEALRLGGLRSTSCEIPVLHAQVFPVFEIPNGAVRLNRHRRMSNRRFAASRSGSPAAYALSKTDLDLNFFPSALVPLTVTVRVLPSAETVLLALANTSPPFIVVIS
jgi:hypothetical protein